MVEVGQVWTDGTNEFEVLEYAGDEDHKDSWWIKNLATDYESVVSEIHLVGWFYRVIPDQGPKECTCSGRDLWDFGHRKECPWTAD